MPFVHDGGANSSAASPVVVVRNVSAATGEVVTTAVQTEQAVAIANTPIKTLTAGTPDEGFPEGAAPGQFYIFASQPNALYTIGPDFVWRAVLLVPVT